MKNKLPVLIENNELPKDTTNMEIRNNNSLGYVNILYIVSLIITSFSIAVVMVLRK